MKFNARAFCNVTFDFEIEAEDDYTAERKVKQYLKFVQGGKIDKQNINLNVNDEDDVTNIFIMDTEVEDVYEID